MGLNRFAIFNLLRRPRVKEARGFLVVWPAYKELIVSYIGTR